MDFIEVKPTTWLCFMTILSFFIVCARFEVFGQLTSYVPAMSATRRPFQGPFDVVAGAASTPSIDVAQDRHAREEGRAAGRVRRREQGLGALSPCAPRVASPSDARASSIPLLT